MTFRTCLLKTLLKTKHQDWTFSWPNIRLIQVNIVTWDWWLIYISHTYGLIQPFFNVKIRNINWIWSKRYFASRCGWWSVSNKKYSDDPLGWSIQSCNKCNLRRRKLKTTFQFLHEKIPLNGIHFMLLNLLNHTQSCSWTKKGFVFKKRGFTETIPFFFITEKAGRDNEKRWHFWRPLYIVHSVWVYSILYTQAQCQWGTRYVI